MARFNPQAHGKAEEQDEQALPAATRALFITADSKTIKPDETPYERLLREGHVRPARRGAHHLITSTGELPEGVTLRQLLDEDREEIDLDALR